jgi:hypothetical protein
VLLCSLGQHFWSAHAMEHDEWEHFSAARALERADSLTARGEEVRAADYLMSQAAQASGNALGRGGEELEGEGRGGDGDGELAGEEEPRIWERSEEESSSKQEPSECERGDSILEEFGLTNDDAGWAEGLDCLMGGIDNWVDGRPPPDLPFDPEHLCRDALAPEGGGRARERARHLARHALDEARSGGGGGGGGAEWEVSSQSSGDISSSGPA